MKNNNLRKKVELLKTQIKQLNNDLDNIEGLYNLAIKAKIKNKLGLCFLLNRVKDDPIITILNETLF